MILSLWRQHQNRNDETVSERKRFSNREVTGYVGSRDNNDDCPGCEKHYMTVLSTVLGYLFRLPMGVLLAVSDKED